MGHPGKPKATFTVSVDWRGARQMWGFADGGFIQWR
jgi:hypothetical protein